MLQAVQPRPLSSSELHPLSSPSSHLQPLVCFMLPVLTQGLLAQQRHAGLLKILYSEPRMWTVRPACTTSHAEARMATSLFFILCMWAGMMSGVYPFPPYFFCFSLYLYLYLYLSLHLSIHLHLPPECHSAHHVGPVLSSCLWWGVPWLTDAYGTQVLLFRHHCCVGTVHCLQ